MCQKKKRNKPCPCVSGLKFKECSIGLSEEQIQEKSNASQKAFEEHMKPLKKNVELKR